MSNNHDPIKISGGYVALKFIEIIIIVKETPTCPKPLIPSPVEEIVRP
ncbi:11832_t:CDS:1, partial [Entrophospora sp. SA101]